MDDKYSKLFAQRLKEAREAKGLSKGELEAALGFGNSLISKYEAGGSVPSITNVIKLARYLNVNESWLMGTSDKPKTGLKAYNAIIKAFEELGILNPGEEISQELLDAIIPIAKTMAYSLRKIKDK